MAKASKPIYMTIIGVIVLILLLLFAFAGLITDYFWFDALGFETIFTISLWAKIYLFLAAAVTFFIFFNINVMISSKFSDSKKNPISLRIKILLSLILSFFVGIMTSGGWFTVKQYLDQVQFGVQDPIFMKDVAFYVFSLPFYLFVLKFAIACVFITAIAVLIDYLKSAVFTVNTVKAPGPDFDPTKNVSQPDPIGLKTLFSKLKRHAMIHLASLCAIFFILLAVKHYFARFSIMYSEQGIVVGAGYSDVVAYLPMIKIMMVLAIIVAILLVVWIFYFSVQKRLKKRHILMYAIFIYVLFGFIGPTLIPGAVQVLKVDPNEINLETPYIINNIEFTRMAYGLSDVEENDFSVELSLTADKLANASETIDNVRILDWRPLTQTYKQMQEIRLYYDLSGIDIDRYNIEGKYTQVMLAPRELDQTQITYNAQTWVNLHMIYSHGFGLVMSPVNSVTREGLPNYFVKDIPPSYSVDEPTLNITMPRVYYGEQDNEFMLVNTDTEEFDYPKGSTNQYYQYTGKGGVTLDSFMKKVLMALRFKDIKILLSSDITQDSKIMFTRHISDRIYKLTPFLLLDNDPYIVIADGGLYWIQDAYTVTGNYPYSQKYGNINYIRNSVKVVVNAYDGDVTYYVVDPEDPLIQTYSNIFPGQFKDYDLMPDTLKEHTRYPEDLFKIQSEIYSIYHMEDPTVFYNKEDAWQIPYEIYGIGQKVIVEPYYMIMKLPEETREEFVLMSSFTPIKKDNMIAWMAARSDGENYGKLILYKFPKDKLIYGPLQIEAKFDQDSEISQQLTLWSQQGSRVTRGNLLVIPIDNGILYIEPLYLQAETGQLPELKRVLVSDGERVVMELDLATALKTLFGKPSVIKTSEGVGVDTEDKTFDELVQQASDYYSNMEEAMTNQDWTGIGTNFDKLGDVLNALEE